MGLYKKQDGLVFDDDFSIQHDRWTFSPSNLCSVEGGQLHVIHTEYETTALFDLPNRPNLLIEASADYVPALDGDEGGILVWRSAINRLDFLESVYTTDGEYAMWRAKKVGSDWFFYAKKNGVWEFIDNAPIAGVKAGLVLKNNGTGFINMAVDHVILCEGDYFIVSNIDDRFSLEIYDENNNLVDSYGVEANHNGIEVYMDTIPFTGYLKLYKDGVLEDESDLLTIYGGDVYAYGPNLDIYWNGSELDHFDPTYLGKLRNNELNIKMSVVNNTEFDSTGVSLAVKQYKQDTGFSFVDVALDYDGTPGTFGDTVLIGDVAAGQSKDFWVKIVRTDFDMFSLDPLYFTVDVLYS